MDTHSVGPALDAGAQSSLPADIYDKPHIPERCRVGLVAANSGKPLAQYDGDTEVILKRLRAGESARAIALSLGVTHVSLYEWLIRHSPEEWKTISAGKALARIEQAESDMDSAENQVDIAKARESHRMGAWAVERVARAMYGDNKAESGGITVQVLIARDGEVQTNVIPESP
jgi:hypothetical protein